MKLNELLHCVDGKDNRIPTSIASLDEVIGGLLVGGISVMAARPVMGKTTFAMTIVRNVGIINQIPTAIISLEDDSYYIAKRLVATQFGWNAVGDIEQLQMKLTSEQKEKIAMLQIIGFQSENFATDDYLEKMNVAPVWVEHDMYVNMDEIVRKIERLKRENDIKLVVIDSFSHILMDGNASDKNKAVQNLLYTAERLNVAVLVTARVLRSVEERGGLRKPMLSDLENDALLEKYASLIMFLYRPEYYCIYEDDLGSTLNMADIIIARNRQGDVGNVRLKFVNKARFDSLPFNVSAM